MNNTVYATEMRDVRVDQGNEETFIHSKVFKYHDKCRIALQKILKFHHIYMSDIIGLSNSIAVTFIESENELPIEVSRLQSVFEHIRKEMHITITTYTEAYVTQSPIIRTNAEKHLLDLNAAVFYAKQEIAGEYWIAPGSSWEWRMDPTDPAILACPEPSDITYESIELARVTGVRATDDSFRSLLLAGDEVEIIISLDHRLSEVSHKTTLAEAQDIWKGQTKLTAKVRIAGNCNAEIIGEMVLVRG